MTRVTPALVFLTSVLYMGWLVGPGTPYDIHQDGSRQIREAAIGHVVMLGDSIAYNLGRLEHVPTAGLPGDTISGLRWRLEHGAMPAPGSPVVLVIGTNDVLYGASPVAMESERTDLVLDLTAAGCGVLVLDEIPRGPDGVHPDRAGYAALADTAGLTR